MTCQNLPGLSEVFLVLVTVISDKNPIAQILFIIFVLSIFDSKIKNNSKFLNFLLNKGNKVISISPSIPSMALPMDYGMDVSIDGRRTLFHFFFI